MKNKFIPGFVTGLLCCILLGVLYGCEGTDENKLTEKQSVSSMSSEAQNDYNMKIEEIVSVLEKYYYKDFTEEELLNGIYHGLVNSLGDPYTVYFDQKEYSKFTESTSGNYAGIGCMVRIDEDYGYPKIVQAFPGSPATKAGIVAGDLVVEIEGEDIQGMDLDLAVAKMKGEPDTVVHCKMFRPSTEEYFEADIVRAFVKRPTVEYQVTDDNIGYVYVLEFDGVTAEQFETAIRDLLSKGIKGLVIDLRDNPGGMLSAVTSMLSLFVPDGELLVYMEDKAGNREEYTAKGTQIVKDMPTVIMINGNSASASEVFAGCMQDYGYATLLGTRSFGKGIVQSLIPLSGDTAVKVTVSSYYTPKGRNIHGIGFEPDVPVELDPNSIHKDEIITMTDVANDNQIRAAVEEVKKKIQ